MPARENASSTRLIGPTGTPAVRRVETQWSASSVRNTASSAFLARGWTDLTHRRVTLQLAGRQVVLTGTDGLSAGTEQGLFTPLLPQFAGEIGDPGQA